jgi:hypothetical protein
VRLWTGFNWTKVESLAGSFENSNKLPVSIKGGEFFDRISD